MMCFLTGLKLSLVDKLLPLLWLKSCLKKYIIATWRTPLNLHSDGGTHFTAQVFQQVYAVWPVLQHFHCIYCPRFSGLVEHTNDVIKI